MLLVFLGALGCFLAPSGHSYGQSRSVLGCEIEEEIGKDTFTILSGSEAGEVGEFHWRYSAVLEDNQLRTLLIEGEKGWQPSAYGFDPQGPSVSVRHEVERQEFGDRLIYSIFKRAEVLSHDRIMIETWRAWADEQRVHDRKYGRLLLDCSPHGGG